MAVTLPPLLTADDLAPVVTLLQQILTQQTAAAQPADDYLTVDQVAAITHTSARTVRKWMDEGKYDQKGHLIKLFALEFSPGYLRIPRSALLAYGQAQGFDASQLPLPPAAAIPKAKRPVLDSEAALRRAS